MNQLSIRGVCLSFGGLVAVDNVSLELSAGDRHALVGPNGAGKTTLLNLVAGAARPTRGEIHFVGRNVTRDRPARRSRAGMARTFQTPALWSTVSALEHLVVGAWRHHKRSGPLGLPGTARHRALVRRGWHYLQQLGLHTHLDVAAGQLSHGQRRLLELGVALAGQPQLLLLDEPAAGLADADLDLLVTLLRRLDTEVTLLLVEHNLDLVSAVARTVTVLHEGRILTTGTPREIETHPQVRQVYLGDTTSPPC